jgi:hypothetical protein
MIASDPICSITIPKDDEIVLADIKNYQDRWFLAFTDVYDNEKNEKVGEIMYEASSYHNIFLLNPWLRTTPESFTPCPKLDDYATRFGKPFPESVDLLNPSDEALYQMTETQTSYITFGGVQTDVTRPVMMVKAYSSWKGCAKARAEYFIRNRDFLELDPDIDADKFFMDNVHPAPIERDADYSPDSFMSKAYKGETVNPIITIGKMCESLEKSGEEWK